MATTGALLLGRRTYEDLLTSWNEQGGPFKDMLNDTPKYVASTTLAGRCQAQLELLEGDASTRSLDSGINRGRTSSSSAAATSWGS